MRFAAPVRGTSHFFDTLDARRIGHPPGLRCFRLPLPSRRNRGVPAAARVSRHHRAWLGTAESVATAGRRYKKREGVYPSLPFAPARPSTNSPDLLTHFERLFVLSLQGTTRFAVGSRPPWSLVARHGVTILLLPVRGPVFFGRPVAKSDPPHDPEHRVRSEPRSSNTEESLFLPPGFSLRVGAVPPAADGRDAHEPRTHRARGP